MPENEYIGKIYLKRGEKCYKHPDPDPNTGEFLVLTPTDDVGKIWEGIDMDELERLEDVGKIAIRKEGDDSPVENRAQDLPGEFSSRISPGKTININRQAQMDEERREELREDLEIDDDGLDYEPDTVPREGENMGDTNYGLDKRYVEDDENPDEKTIVDHN